MITERVLSLDMSTKTGFSLIISSPEGLVLENYGMLSKISQPEGPYPSVFVDWAELVFDKIKELIIRFKPDVLVIEETVAGSKAVYSQKILEYCHFLLAKYIRETKIKSVYMLTGEWRSIVAAKMTKEESLHNKEVKKYKQKNKTSIAYDEKGKRIGRLTKKHINIRRANEIFGKFLKEPLRKKNEDEADALLLGASYHLRKIKVANETIIE